MCHLNFINQSTLGEKVVSLTWIRSLLCITNKLSFDFFVKSVILAKKYIDLLKKGLEIVIISKENFMMAGCLDNVRLGVPEWLEVGNRRNIGASIISGLLVK